MNRLLVTVLAILAALAVSLVGLAAIRAQTYPVQVLRDRPPRHTAMMSARAREARSRGRATRIDQRWVSYERISPLLRRAVLIAEDDAFFTHSGLDWNEIQAAAKTNLEKRRVARGGSTITQQLAKNLYLSEHRTLTRKIEEVLVALRLERTLSKRRIFELYLNLIEWGDGIYGIEAASRRYFGVSAGGLSERQAVLLAAVIINPRRYSVLAPPRRIEKRVRLIASRMKRRGFLTDAQYRVAIGAPAPKPEGQGFRDWFFGGKPDTVERTGTDSVAAPGGAAAESTETESP